MKNQNKCVCNFEGLCPRKKKHVTKLEISQCCKDKFDSVIKDHKIQCAPDYLNCSIANKNQEYLDLKIKEAVNKRDFSTKTVDDLMILCLGHSQSQFDSIKKRKYLKNVNLNNLDCGRFSGNEWAESRIFLSKEDLFEDKEFVGVVTASFNMKYRKAIDDFHNWPCSLALLDSKPEDNIIICANTACQCVWTCFVEGITIFKQVLGERGNEVGEKFAEFMGLEWKHEKSLYSNQIICHRDNYDRYVDYLVNEEVFERVDWFCKNLEKDFYKINSDFDIYIKRRIPAYFMEYISVVWWGNNDMNIISNSKFTDDWYQTDTMTKRVVEWKN